MPREYHFMLAGNVTSVTVLAANSQRVAIASGCTVFLTPLVPRCFARTQHKAQAAAPESTA